MKTAALSEAHRYHLAVLRGMPAIIDAEGLRIGRQFVMFFAETELMRRHAVRLIDGFERAHVLEVGLGLGVFAEQLATMNVSSYTAIEPHPGVARLAHERVLSSFPVPAAVLIDPWQLAALPTGAFDAIMYDTWPPDGLADPDFAEFVEHVAIPCLRPGGRFSFFHSGATIGRARREILDRHFPGWTADRYTMPPDLVPPHWTKPTRDFLIPKATKGRA
jgi:spermidine synthase